MSQRYPDKTYTILLFITCLSIVLRLYTLGKVSIWFDEAITIFWTRNLSSLFKGSECTPPLYFLLVYCWEFFAHNDFTLRLLPLIFGIASVVGIYFVGKLFFDTRTAVIGSFILAISPLHIFYSQELTPYSFFTFLVLLSIYFLKKALEDGGWGFWVGFSFFSVLSILTHYTAIFILLSEIFFFLLFWRKHRNLSKQWLMSHFLILVFLSTWLLFLIQQIIFGIKIHIGWWIPPASLRTIAITFKNFSIGYNATPGIFFVTSAAYFLLFALGTYVANKRRDLTLLLFFTFIPILCTFVLFKLKVMAYVDRYFLPSSLFYYLVIARGLSAFKNKYIFSSIMIVVTVLSGFALRNYYLNFLPNSFNHHVGVQKKPDFRSAAYYIARDFKKGDVIVHTNENSTFSLEYYLNSQYYCNLRDLYFFSWENPKRLWVKPQNDLGSIKVVRYNLGDQIPGYQDFFRDQGVSWEKHSRVWVIMLLFQDPEAGLSVVRWMDGHYRRLEEKEFYGLKVYLYNKVAN